MEPLGRGQGLAGPLLVHALRPSMEHER
jgi:hypothetical protein